MLPWQLTEISLNLSTEIIKTEIKSKSEWKCKNKKTTNKNY